MNRACRSKAMRASGKTADPIAGTCLCGAVTISVISPKREIEVCQCDMCRRWSGSFYTALTGESHTVDGEQMVTRYQSSEWAERGFCSQCGSNLWYEFLPTGGRSYSAGLFDEAADFAIEKEIFVDERAKWTRLKGDHPCQTAQEVIAEAEAAGFTFD